MKSSSTICAVVLALTMLAAPSAEAAEPDPKTAYREAVEPICKSNTEANKRILKNVKKEVRQGKLKLAGRQFGKAGAALNRAHAELAAVPKPAEYATKLTRWLSLIGTEVTLFKKAGSQLEAGSKTAAQATVIRLQRNANKANNQVAVFEFRYCRFDTSKFA
jgi:hypothetical protein